MHTRKLTATAFAGLCAVTPLAAQEAMPELYGTWKSMACELRPQAGPTACNPGT